MTIDHSLDKISPPNNLLDPGSASQRPYALIARDRIGHESVFVTELLPDRAVLRATAKGYSVYLLKDGKVYQPSDRSVCTRTVGSREAILPAVLQGSRIIEAPLSDEEADAVIAAIEGLPANGPAAHRALRIRVGHEVVEPSWMHERFSVKVRAALRGY